jgi:chemotaxis signal transduction protein
LDVMGIREILRSQKLTPVPHTPRHIAGVVNLRGELIPVINLHRILLGDDGPGAAQDRKLVVARARGKTAGLLVDQVLDVLSIPLESLRPVPVEQGGEFPIPVVVAAFRKGADGGGVVVLIRLGPLVETEYPIGSRAAVSSSDGLAAALEALDQSGRETTGGPRRAGRARRDSPPSRAGELQDPQNRLG